MSGWRRAHLDEVVTLQRGYDLPQHARTPGDIPVVGSAGISGSHYKAREQGPGVVIGRSGASIGHATYVQGPYWPLNTGLFVRDFKNNDPRWVFHALDSIDFSGFDSGSAQPSLNRNFLAKIPVSVPPRTVQRAIADVLSALDAKIAANSEIATVSDGLALALASRFAPSLALGGVARQSKETINPAVLDDESVIHYSLPAYDAGQNPDAVSPATIKSNKFLVAAPGVLLSKLNPRFPRVWNLTELSSGVSLASTEFVVLRSDYCSPSLLWSLIAQPGFGAQLEGMVAGTSGSHQRVKPSEILAVEVPDPREIPAEDAQAIESLALRAIAAREESWRLAAIRNALLPALMSGRLTVRNAEMVGDGAVGGGAVESEAPVPGTLW